MSEKPSNADQLKAGGFVMVSREPRARNLTFHPFYTGWITETTERIVFRDGAETVHTRGEDFWLHFFKIGKEGEVTYHGVAGIKDSSFLAGLTTEPDKPTLYIAKIQAALEAVVNPLFGKTATEINVAEVADSEGE